MAEDVLDNCFKAALLPARAGGATSHLKLVGAHNSGHTISEAPGPHLYGSEAASLESLPGASRELGGGLTEAMVRFAARHEYARTVEDMLARRFRLLFTDAAMASGLAAEVGELLRSETGVDPRTAEFRELAASYLRMPV